VETLAAQAALARRYGLSGFCFYYYNFGGRRLLEQPLDRWIASGSRGLSFCLCWANESWTQHWDGESGATIVEQLYDVSSMKAVVEDLIPYLRHPDYIRVDGRPLILIYRVDELPEPSSVAEIWRSRCRQQGIGEIYLTFVESFGRAVDLLEPSSIGFDASVEFPPHLTSRGIREPGPLVNARFSGVISDYRQIALHYASKPLPGFTRFRTAMPSWDNTARQQDRPYIFHHSTPGAFQAWLETLIEQTVDQNFGDEKIVFVNAWNEWAEGAYLEPDRRFGHGYLEAVRNALDRIHLSEPFQATDSEAV
jgi:lipopolysaccharide biosynthesis protein